MTTEQTTRLLEITQRKMSELLEELIAEVSAAAEEEDELAAVVRGPDGVAAMSRPNGAQSSVLDAVAPRGDWVETGRVSDETYDWPDGNHDEYYDFVSYRGTGDYEGASLALGHLDYGDVVGFWLDRAGGKRGITWFYKADDFDETKEKISFIRGNGPTGRKGFAPDEPLPRSYEAFNTDVLAKRKARKWNRLGVIANEGDYKTMLGHTFLQARLRGLA